MSPEAPAYGLWSLVLINAAVFIIFAFSFTRPRTTRDWRSFGAFAGFLVALFTEMYGFPLTLYLLSGWLGSRYPGLDFFSHDTGHLWQTLLGWKGDPHVNPLHLLSNGLIFGGFILLASAWRVLYEAQREGKLATTGPYAYVRHPQYGGIILIKDDVRDVVLAIRLSRATLRKIKQNLFWAFIYNSIGIPVAAFGFLSPILAAAAMAISSLSVNAKSALLKRLKLERV